jgi:hypothetical protein
MARGRNLMHPDLLQLAAYLDSALDPATQAELRAHILTCAKCAASLDQLRADGRRIAAALAAAPPPDVRAGVRARLRRPDIGAWLGQAAGLAGAVLALLLFALLLGAGGAGTALRAPERLLVADRRGGQLLVLDAATGARLDAVHLGDQPGALVFDQPRDRIYLAMRQSVVALDAHSLQPVARWIAPRPLDTGVSLALDTRRARLYLTQPGGVLALALDQRELAIADQYDLGGDPGALALAPDAGTLLALGPREARLWAIDLRSGSIRATTLQSGAPTAARAGWLAAGPGGAAYVLLTLSSDAGQPALWRISPGGQVERMVALAALQPPWDLVLLGEGRLAIARGNGSVGGVELVDPATLAQSALIDRAHDQHHLVAGAGAELYGLNFTHGTVTRYDTRGGAVVWRVELGPDVQPWDGALLPGGWRWPWEQ